MVDWDLLEVTEETLERWTFDVQAFKDPDSRGTHWLYAGLTIF